MKVIVFSTKSYDRRFLATANEAAGSLHERVFLEARLDAGTARLVEEAGSVCAFANDRLDAAALEVLAEAGVSLVALRCAGFTNVDLAAAERLGIGVTRVPAYSPHAVAEHAVALIQPLNRNMNLSDHLIRNDVFVRLLTFPDVLITGHQGLFTAQALEAIAATTVENITRFEQTGQPAHKINRESLPFERRLQTCSPGSCLTPAGRSSGTARNVTQCNALFWGAMNGPTCEERKCTATVTFRSTPNLPPERRIGSVAASISRPVTF